MSKKAVKYLSLILSAAILVGFIGFQAGWFGKKEEGGPAAAAAKPAGEPEKIVVKAVILSPQTMTDRIRTKGSVMPNEEVMITTEISGVLKKISFKEGDQVKQGQVLATMDDSELVAQLERAEYELTFLEKKLAREERLKSSGGVSDEQYEGTLRDKNAKQADINLLKARMEKALIRAPFSGQIGLRYVSEGAFLNPSTAIAQLVDFTPAKVDFSVPERYMAQVKIGDQIRFMVEGIREELPGRVYAIEPKIDPSTRTIRLRAVCTQPNAEVIPGAFANVEMILTQQEGTLALPTEAIVPEMDRKKVFVVRNGKAAEQTVETGMRTPDRIQIISGLAAGDTVIVSGVLQIRSGSSLNISIVQ